MNAQDLYTRMAELSASNVPFAQLTVTGVRGSTPRAVGASMLVLADGSILGTIGGGVLERQATEDALARLGSGASGTETYRLTQSGDHALGARCGGEVRVFFHVHGARETLVVMGAGHVGREICALAGRLDFRVVMIDSRRELATGEHLPAASEVACPPDGLWTPDICPVTPLTSVVVVTHSAERDRDALRSVIATDAGYIGLMGSRRKIADVFRELEAGGVSRERLERVHAPIGLPIGAETPAELALSILAEIVAVRSRRARVEEPAAPVAAPSAGGPESPREPAQDG